jgi:hypothetical protein
MNSLPPSVSQLYALNSHLQPAGTARSGPGPRLPRACPPHVPQKTKSSP